MSKSYRKPYGTFFALKTNDRNDKRIAKRAVRRMQNHWLRTLEDFDDALIPHRLEARNNDPWGWSSDGPKHLMVPGKISWFHYQQVVNNGPFQSELDEEHTRRHDSVWPPTWYVEAQRK